MMRLPVGPTVNARMLNAVQGRLVKSGHKGAPGTNCSVAPFPSMVIVEVTMVVAVGPAALLKSSWIVLNSSSPPVGSTMVSSPLPATHWVVTGVNVPSSR
jgi:hypothetical protein